ncbi:protein transport protein Sec24A isoform X1 [Scyliorhinus canicula]|uniref:protein transport protein Sec24A isoform X1 n=1 Tax=Scyliorhinus canicula TaxID=7830 RepID=UPI0018F6212A|nr:protein transport protein Sec24A isoform X1 [Scyliorhinus canicula]
MSRSGNSNSGGYSSPKIGAGAPLPCLNGPLMNQHPSIPTEQGYNVIPPAPYPQQIPAKNFPHLATEHQNYEYHQHFQPGGNFQSFGQTASRPQPNTPHLQKGTSADGQSVHMAAYAGSYSRMAQPSQGSFASATSSSVHTGASNLPQTSWQYNPPQQSHPVSQPPAGMQANHVVPGAGTGQVPYGNAGPKPAVGNQYANVAGGSFVQSYANQVGSSQLPVNQPLNQMYQPGRTPLGPPPSSGGPPLIRATHPVATTNHDAPLTQNLLRDSEGVNIGSSGDRLVAPDNYDTVEGGGEIMQPIQQGLKTRRTLGHSYPSLPPGYQNMASPGIPGGQLANTEGPQQFSQTPHFNQLMTGMGGLSLQQNQQSEAARPLNLLQERNILPSTPVKAPHPNLHQDLQKLNCNPDVFRCTLTNIPQTQSLLSKAKLPLGLQLHPFRDLSQLPVVTSSTIVRCRTCRTYINPFVNFLDQRRWKCNLCYRVNDVPEEFMYNPVTRSYGEPHKRPEVQSATIEFIAPSEYMLRPPQPAVYLYILDVSHNAVESGYVNTVCQSLLDNLDVLPGDSRTRIGFITFDSTIHFYSLQEGLSQPQMMVVSDIEDIFIPTPDNLLVNLNESKELIQDLLRTLPQMFTNTLETQSALGPALQAAFKLMSPTGGRASVFQTQLPSLGVGALKSREDPNQRSSLKDVQHLSPAIDFYKKLALDCSGQQIAVDLFMFNSQYSDLASLTCISKYSAGCIYSYPSYHHKHNPVLVEKFQKDLKRYLTRKIGFEAVMRIRCTKGLAIHTFHGNFFVRSTDLLSLPNINPDSGFAVQMSIEENLVDVQLVSFQAALLYTSSKGERRIRVHTMCLPVVNSLTDIYAGADVQAVTCLLASMAVDRSISSSLSDARDALVNAVIDSLSTYRTAVLSQQQQQQPGVMAPSSLQLFPLYVLALLKQKAFRTGTSTRLDDRVFSMCEVKYQPVSYLVLMIHPNLYRIDNLSDEGSININDKTIPQPPILQLSVEKLNRDGAFLMDAGTMLYLWVGKKCCPNFVSQVLGASNYVSIPQNMTQLPELNTAESERTRAFISWLREQRPFFPVLHVIKDESPLKPSFLQNMVEDRTESALSYYEFLLHIQQQVNK